MGVMSFQALVRMHILDSLLNSIIVPLSRQLMIATLQMKLVLASDGFHFDFLLWASAAFQLQSFVECRAGFFKAVELLIVAIVAGVDVDIPTAPHIHIQALVIIFASDLCRLLIEVPSLITAIMAFMHVDVGGASVVVQAFAIVHRYDGAVDHIPHLIIPIMAIVRIYVAACWMMVKA